MQGRNQGYQKRISWLTAVDLADRIRYEGQLEKADLGWQNWHDEEHLVGSREETGSRWYDAETFRKSKQRCSRSRLASRGGIGETSPMDCRSHYRIDGDEWAWTFDQCSRLQQPAANRLIQQQHQQQRCMNFPDLTCSAAQRSAVQCGNPFPCSRAMLWELVLGSAIQSRNDPRQNAFPSAWPRSHCTSCTRTTSKNADWPLPGCLAARRRPQTADRPMLAVYATATATATATGADPRAAGSVFSAVFNSG
jgi:hypothetical protein